MENHKIDPFRQFEDKANEQAENEFAESVFKKCISFMQDSLNRERRITDVYASPDDIRAAVDISLGSDKTLTLGELDQQIDRMIPFLVRTRHPMFFNQLFAGQDMVGVAAQWFSTSCNTSVYTYEMAPVFSLLETEVLHRMRGMCGWDAAKGDGIFAPGGSYSNLMAINVARHARQPSIKEEGMSGVRLVMFSSGHAHYSMAKAAAALGIGTKNCVKVECDEGGRMIPAALEASIAKARAEGGVPFCVVATAGSTVTGAFDPIREIVAIARKPENNLWVHVDGAWGGAVLCSSKYRKLMDGVEEADSLTWNPHKMMGVPQQCSALLTKESGHLMAAHSAQASYLFQKDKNYAELDTGDKTLQCGRLPDVFKLWCAWKVHGTAGYERIIDHAFAIADHLRAQIAAREGYEMAVPGEFVNVCFYYVPPSARNLEGDARDQKLHKIAPYIKSRMQETGSTMVGYQPIGDKPQFFRMVNMNPRVTTKDMDNLLDLIEKFGLEWDAKHTN